MRDLGNLTPWRLLIAVLIAAMVATAGPPPAVAESQRIVLGRISEKPRDHFERMRAMADFLADQLAADGVTGVDVVLVDSLEEMQELMVTGRVDIASETAFMALDLVDSGVAELMLREWKHGVAEYHSVFFARKDAGLGGIDDLLGHTIAFEDPGSTSAYLIPRVALELAGIELVRMDQPGDEVPADELGFVFADGEINVVAWVHRGLADAGVVSNLDWENENEAPSFLKDDLVIIHETPPFIRSLLLVRKDLAPDLKSTLAELFLGMHETEAGRRALQQYFSVSRYDRINAAVMDGLETIRQNRRFLQD